MEIYVAWNSGKKMKKKVNPDWTHVWYKYKPCLNNQSSRTDTLTWKVLSSAWRSADHNQTGGPFQHLSGAQSPWYLFFYSKGKLFSEQTVWFLPSDVLTWRSEMQYMWKIDHMECRCVHGFIASIPTIRLFYLLDCWLWPWAMLPYLHSSGNHAPSH